MTNSDLCKKAEELAYGYLSPMKTVSCATTVLLSIQEIFGPKDDLLLKAASIMAGGSRSESFCGALAGGVLALGMRCGLEREQFGDIDALIEGYQPIMEYYKKFEAEFGSRYCYEIIQADLSIPEQRQQWLDRGGWESCAKLAGKASGIVADIMLTRAL
ncbi:MAG: C-GCAxxG-C-C family protein [Desulfobacterales bacterium]|jgi:C_GCAxxG_C_C family probable redox protein